MSEEKLTKTFQDDYKGNRTFAIWQVDKDGNQVGHVPVVKSMGRAKAKLILKHLKELEEFANGSEAKDI